MVKKKRTTLQNKLFKGKSVCYHYSTVAALVKQFKGEERGCKCKGVRIWLERASEHGHGHGSLEVGRIVNPLRLRHQGRRSPYPLIV